LGSPFRIFYPTCLFGKHIADAVAASMDFLKVTSHPRPILTSRLGLHQTSPTAGPPPSSQGRSPSQYSHQSKVVLFCEQLPRRRHTRGTDPQGEGHSVISTRTLSGREEYFEYIICVVHEMFAPLAKPYVGGVPIAPCRFFFYPPSNTGIIDTATTGTGVSRWLVKNLEESDSEPVQPTSRIQRTIWCFRTWIPVFACIWDGRRPVAWLVEQLDGSLGARCVDLDYRGETLGRNAQRG